MCLRIRVTPQKHIEFILYVVFFKLLNSTSIVSYGGIWFTDANKTLEKEKVLRKQCHSERLFKQIWKHDRNVGSMFWGNDCCLQGTLLGLKRVGGVRTELEAGSLSFNEEVWSKHFLIFIPLSVFLLDLALIQFLHLQSLVTRRLPAYKTAQSQQKL